MSVLGGVEADGKGGMKKKMKKEKEDVVRQKGGDGWKKECSELAGEREEEEQRLGHEALETKKIRLKTSRVLVSLLAKVLPPTSLREANERKWRKMQEQLVQTAFFPLDRSDRRRQSLLILNFEVFLSSSALSSPVFIHCPRRLLERVGRDRKAVRSEAADRTKRGEDGKGGRERLGGVMAGRGGGEAVGATGGGGGCGGG